MGKAEWGADPEFFGPRHAHREGRITGAAGAARSLPGAPPRVRGRGRIAVSHACPEGAHGHLGRPFAALAPGARQACRISWSRRTGSAGGGRYHSPPVRQRDLCQRHQRRNPGAHSRPRRGRRRARARTRARTAGWSARFRLDPDSGRTGTSGRVICDDTRRAEMKRILTGAGSGARGRRVGVASPPTLRRVLSQTGQSSPSPSRRRSRKRSDAEYCFRPRPEASAGRPGAIALRHRPPVRRRPVGSRTAVRRPQEKSPLTIRASVALHRRGLVVRYRESSHDRPGSVPRCRSGPCGAVDPRPDRRRTKPRFRPLRCCCRHRQSARHDQRAAEPPRGASFRAPVRRG